MYNNNNKYLISPTQSLTHLFIKSKQPLKKLQTCKLYQFPLNSTTTILNTQQQNSNTLIKLYIKTTLNNMFITLITPIKTSTTTLSAFGFKGKSKQTIYAYKMFAEDNIHNLQLILASNPNALITIYANPLNSKLKTFLKLYKSHSISIYKIYDITPIPYNGCKKKKIAIKKKKKSVIKFLSYR